MGSYDRGNIFAKLNQTCFACLFIPKRLEDVYNSPYSEYPSTYVGQPARQFTTCMKEHQSDVRRQDENSLLALHCLTIGLELNENGNGLTKRTWGFIEAWSTTPTCVNQNMTKEPF